MEARDKMKYILEDIYELERQLRVYRDVKEKINKKNKDLEVAAEEYLVSIKTDVIQLHDKVKVVKDCPNSPTFDFPMYKGEVGTVVSVDEDYKYPYLIRFDNQDLEKHSNKTGGPLWAKEQLEIM